MSNIKIKRISWVSLYCLLTLLVLMTQSLKIDLTTNSKTEQSLSQTAVSSSRGRFKVTSKSRGNEESMGSSAFIQMNIGLCLIIFAFAILWNNERKSVKIQSLISKARKQCIEVDYRNPAPEDNFKLVYTSGITTNKEQLMDRDFELEVENSVRLIRIVEMYQWVQHENKSKNHTEYSYQKEWRRTLVDSSFFHDTSKVNPSSMVFLDQT